jgi:small multidrug resistance pump
MARWFLLGAIVVEVGATSLMPSTAGFTRWQPTVVCLLGYALSFTLFARALQGLPVGLSYAVWSGAGTVAVVVIGALFLGERLDLRTVGGVVLVLAGVAVLHLSATEADGDGADVSVPPPSVLSPR